jgi:timeless
MLRGAWVRASVFPQIRMLDLVLKLLPGDSKEPLTARILLYKLFYDQTDQGMTQFLLSLIKSFDTHKQTKRFSSYAKT